VTPLWLKILALPVIRSVFYRILFPVWSFVLSSLEALKYLRQRSESKQLLADMRDFFQTGKELADWYAVRNFQWVSDPWKGRLDFVSKAWVSVARNCGDCDDMMAIAEAVLKPHYDESHRVHVYSVTGRGHAVYILRKTTDWFLMSNQAFSGPFISLDLAVHEFYHADTYFAYVE
jgi:hypothetical protein